MKIYDISQEVYHCNTYPGDDIPRHENKMSISEGAVCNLSNLYMCVHNGTHVDAPFHFCNDGNTVDQMDLETMVGDATVVAYDGELTAQAVKSIMKTAKKRLLFKGNAIVSLEAAVAMNECGVCLVGCESQSVGPMGSPMQVHLELLGKNVVLLEGIVLNQVPEGDYLLNAAPLNLGGSDGAPCRAILIKL